MKISLVILLSYFHLGHFTIPEYLSECNTKADCQWLGSNSNCYYNYCMCDEGFRWFRGACIKYFGLGEKCDTSVDCYDGYNPEALKCDESNQCVCNEDYYLRDGIDCRKKANAPGDLCALDVDCQFPDGICKLGKCVSSKQESKTENVYELDIYVSDELQSYLGIPPACQNNECDLNNSECYNGMCICQRGFFMNKMGTQCLAEIGMDIQCKDDSDCLIKPGKCVNGVCYCRDYYFTEDGNRRCIKSISQNNFNCLSNEWCYALGKYSYCSSEGICKCSKTAKLNDGLQACEKESDDPTICNSDLSCQNKIRHGVCIDQQCKCKDGYTNQDNKCLPSDIGSACDETFYCTIENSHCDDGFCKCDQNYDTIDSKCYSVPQQLGDNCEIDKQCTNKFMYSICTTNHTCECADGRISYNNNQCLLLKHAGDYCTTKIECTASLGKSFVCRNNQCQCPTGQKVIDDTCVSSGERIHFTFCCVIVMILKTLF